MPMRSEPEYLSRMRSRQRAPSGAASVAAPADGAALLLALQRHAGNHAVSRWLEGRPLQRSCLAPREDLSDLEDPQDCTDIYTAQSREDVVYDQLDVHAATLEAETARALSAPATSPAPAVGAGHAGSPQQHASSGSFQIGADDEDTDMESATDSDTESEEHPYDSDARMADLSEATQLQVNQTPAKLLRAKPNVNPPGYYVPKGGQAPAIPLDPGVLPGANAVPTVPFRGWKQHAYKRKAPGQVYNTDPNLDPFKRAEYGGAGTPAKKAKMVRSGPGNGSRVGWEPDGWRTFLELIGRDGKRTWVMGHFINQRLGGPGRAQNLAPFTYSMNGVHYSAVEKGVIGDVNRAGREVDYTVDAVPGAQGSRNEVDALTWHTNSRGSWAGIAAMVRAGMLSQQDKVTPTSGDDHLVGPSHGWPGEELADRLDHVEDWIKDYVAKTFPLGISCRVRTYPQGVKVVTQTVIDNTPKP